MGVYDYDKRPDPYEVWSDENKRALKSLVGEFQGIRQVTSTMAENGKYSAVFEGYVQGRKGTVTIEVEGVE